MENTAEMPEASSQSEDNSTSPQSKSVHDAEEKIARLEQIIKDLHADFGAHRARFKELFMQKEEDLMSEQATIKTLEKTIHNLRAELDETKSQVTIAELSKENEIELERQRCQHEISALRKFYEDSNLESRANFETELQKLKVINSKLEADLNEVRIHLTAHAASSEVSPGAVLSAMTKSLARKLNSTMSASNDSLHDIEEQPKAKPSKYAHEDAEMLRSLVIQLEEELTSLKDKVRNSDDQLSALQNAQASLVKGNDALTELLQEGKDVQGVLTQLDDKLRETRSGLEAEKSSRADLEMYVALVNAQKTLLQEDLEKTKIQLKDLRQSHEDEKKNHDDLKETWKKANEQFVQTQEAYQSTIRQLKELLTPKQLEQIKLEEVVMSPPLSPVDKVKNKTEQTNPAASATDDDKKNDHCEECEKSQVTIEKLRSELHKAATLRNETEEEWNRISQDFQTKLGAVEDQVGTYELLLLELNIWCQQSIQNMDDQIKRLVFERDSVQKKIEVLEFDNDNLKGKHVAHSHQLQNEYISLPSNVMELHEMVLRLKEELISVKVGKEQIEGEFKFLRDQVQMEEQEKRGIEENLNAEINSLRDRLTDSKHAIEKQQEEAKRYEKSIHDLKAKHLASEAHHGKSSQVHKSNEDLIRDKEHLQKDNSELQNKIATLRKELTNSEELQKDLIALSKSLQMGLESIRQAETEVRWQHPDDISQCNGCKRVLNDNKDKHNCSHCGRIYCAECVNRSVRRGSRDYHVCGFCHTLLAHDSPPYFSTEPPHSPD